MTKHDRLSTDEPHQLAPTRPDDVQDVAPVGPVSAIPSLLASPGMRAAIARRATGGHGNAELQHLLQSRPQTSATLQRSPLSEDLEQVWTTQGKGPFFDRMRALTVSDPDVDTFVNSRLTGDDLWLATNLLRYGTEPNWPIHLRVEREMKGWADSRGKGAVFEILRAAAGAEAANADLTATLERVFAPGSEDIRLARNLQQHGREGTWPSGTLSVAQTLNSAASAGGAYSSPVTITFVPDAKVQATEIAFLQDVRLIRTGTTTSLDTRPNFANRRTGDAWTLDRLPGRSQGWYGFDNNGLPSGTVTPGSAPPPVNASMTDTPGWDEPNSRWEFETAAVARAGHDVGKIYRVITWGFEVDGSNRLTALPIVESDRESAAFQAAVTAWNVQAAGPAAQRNDPGQLPLGPLH